MLKRFVRLFGGAKHGEKQEWLNSRIACAVMAAVCLLFSLMPISHYRTAADDTLRQESFVLLDAEHHHVRRRRSDIDELYLYSMDGEKYTIENEWIRTSEIMEFLEILKPGAQIDLLMSGNSVRELTVDGEILLPKEVTAERGKHVAASIGIIGVIMAVGNVYLCIHIIALHIKKQKGWNF